MTAARIRPIAVALAFFLGAGAALAPMPASAETIQQSAIRDGCKKFYNERTQKAKYRDCVGGRSERSQDALIQGCYARYNSIKDKLRQCLGR